MTANSVCHSECFVAARKWRLQTNDANLSVLRDLSQPMGKKKRSSTAKNATNSVKVSLIRNSRIYIFNLLIPGRHVCPCDMG